MKYFHPTIERHLGKTARRWKWLKFLQHSGTLGTVACFLSLLFGIAILRGWLVNEYVAIVLFAVLMLATGVAWVILSILVAASSGKSRQWLAGHLEKSHSPLLDRLNTIVFLGEKKQHPVAQSYAKRIEAQASTLLKNAKPRNPFPALRALIHLAVFVCTLVGTVCFFCHYQPWHLLSVAGNPLEAPHNEPAFELNPPDSNSSEEKKAWNEVRITDPASDIKATKVDVVPLEIEAASSLQLARVSWSTSIDGDKEQSHLLPMPAEPHYAVYQPVLALDELKLSDWDVVSYYARAETGGGETSSSEIYFIEIRPFREDILKMPGGEGGSAFCLLGECTALIERQRLILRQTHHYSQQQNQESSTREQDRSKLADAETELGNAVSQLYAKIAAKFENQPIGDILDHLAASQIWIGHASTELVNDLPAQAIPSEQGALTELVALRKNFQKFIHEHPDSFKDG
ncbi:MAG: hypothetical protein WCH43_09720, partial [Verrucomicrobiota bacterium]